VTAVDRCSVASFSQGLCHGALDVACQTNPVYMPMWPSIMNG